MLLARFLRPWEVLEMDIHDMGEKSGTGNEYLLVIVDKASKFLFAYSLPTKADSNVAKKVLNFILTFGVTLSLHRDPGTEFTADVVAHLCQWLNVNSITAPLTTLERNDRQKGWGVDPRDTRGAL